MQSWLQHRGNNRSVELTEVVAPRVALTGTMYQKSEMDESVDIELVSGKILDLVQDIEEKTTGHQGESE